MSQQPALIIMAAGIGSRYGGLKQVEPLGPNGEIIIDYSVYDALRAGFGKIIFLIRQEIEDIFRERIGRNVEPARGNCVRITGSTQPAARLWLARRAGETLGHRPCGAVLQGCGRPALRSNQLG